ncbi:MAG: hypothetical protein M3Q71_15305 [Chloroflexota bacterium]|nr:hypothetical protein [Chloroflexota bacterium]
MEFTKAHLRRAHLLAPAVVGLTGGSDARPGALLCRKQVRPGLSSRRHCRGDRCLCRNHKRRQSFAGNPDRHGNVGIRARIQCSSRPLHRREAPPELV